MHSPDDKWIDRCGLGRMRQGQTRAREFWRAMDADTGQIPRGGPCRIHLDEIASGSDWSRRARPGDSLMRPGGAVADSGSGGIRAGESTLVPGDWISLNLRSREADRVGPISPDANGGEGTMA